MGGPLGTRGALQVLSTMVLVNQLTNIYVEVSGPRQHIWTFAAGVHEQTTYTSEPCPCETGSTGGSRVPSFVGENYFCETGLLLMILQYNSWNSM